MAIAFGVAGTHSTGKSTIVRELADALSARGLRVGRVADIATQARDLGFPILRDHTFDSTLWIMTHGISARLAAGLNADVVLVDRPALDAVGYFWAALAHRQEQLLQARKDYLLALARHDANTYHIICRTELDPLIELGPDRDHDQSFRAAAGNEIARVCSQVQINPHVVGTDFSVKWIADSLERAVRDIQGGPALAG
jgi:hypothetical protein